MPSSPPSARRPARAARLLGGVRSSSPKVYCTGDSQTWDDGDQLTHGQAGEVTGQPPSGDPNGGGEFLSVTLPGGRFVTPQLCKLDEISRTRRRSARAHANGSLEPLAS